MYVIGLYTDGWAGFVGHYPFNGSRAIGCSGQGDFARNAESFLDHVLIWIELDIGVGFGAF